MKKNFTYFLILNFLFVISITIGSQTIMAQTEPYIEYTSLDPDYETGMDIEVTARVYSNGVIDNLCGVGYALYRNDVLITDLSEYGTLTYTVRQEDETYYTGTITTGSGMIEVVIGEDEIGAFTLGVFDNTCVNRNRPIVFTANFTIPGDYRMESFIYSCSNPGTPTGTSFLATDCDGLTHNDLIAATCETPVELSSESIEITVLAPYIEFSEMDSEYSIMEDIEVVASVYSNGFIDNICGVGYELYKDDVLVENVADYGTLTYTVRQEGETYYNGTITEGSGMLEITVGEDVIGAFTLGIFDNYCTHRDRPINFTANLDVPGVYRMVSSIYSCSNTGTATGTDFTAVFCDGEVHNDMIDATCESPVELNSVSVEINVLAPSIEFSEINSEYLIGEDIAVVANVYSNGLIDNICGVGYELYKDDVLVENVADYGTLTYTVRQEGETYYNGTITEGSGMLEITVGEDVIGAFTLGIFDNYCVNRNRPINFNANLNVPGVYRMVSNIYSCSNSGTETGTSFPAVNCDGETHNDMIAATCETPVEISTQSFEINILAPYIEFSTLEPQYEEGTDIILTANIYSSGMIDELCGIGYEIYLDDILLTDLTDYGTVNYSVRQEGDTYYNGTISEGSGMIEVTVGEDNIGAFTLGIFDNYCVNRNRPIEFTANFIAAGQYSIVSTLYSCANAGIPTGTSFIATECDGESHDDLIAETCDSPTEIGSETVEFVVYQTGEIIISLQPVSQEICENSSIDLTIEASSTISLTVTYQWYFNSILMTDSTENSITVSEAGEYYCIVTAGLDELSSDIATVTVNPLPAIDLGENQILCDGLSLEITAPVAESYLWNTEETTQAITIDTAGTYICTITDINGCTNSDQMTLSIIASPNVDLGEDITIDEDQVLILGTQTGHPTYAWSTGATTDFIEIVASTLTLGAHSYSVTVTGANGCISEDEVIITVIPGAGINTENLNNYSIFPNPTSGIIEISGNEIISIDIFDNIGRNILTTDESRIDLSSYPTGIYSVRINSKEGSFTSKLIIL